MRIMFICVPYCHFLYHKLSLPPSLPLFLTQTADQEAYDFFTSTVEDQPWPDIGQDAASHEGGEGEGAGERGGGEGEEMDTSVLLEQQVP